MVMKIINTDWSVEGSIKDKADFTRKLGLEPKSAETFEGWYNIAYYHPKKVSGAYSKNTHHFKLPEQYNEAFEYITGEKVVEDREIIGYKLIKPEYKKAVLNITNLPILDGEHRGYDIYADGIAVTPLKEAGVLDLWFEPIYKEEEKPEYKVNDWVIAVGNIPTYKEPTVGRVVELNASKNKDCPYIINFGGKGSRIYSTIKRHATEDEILEAWSKKWMEENDCKIGDMITIEEEDSNREEKLTTFKLAKRSNSEGFWSHLTRQWFENNPNEEYQLVIQLDNGTYSPNAKVVKSKPIVIKGYEAEFSNNNKGDIVNFGCQTFKPEFVEKVNGLIKDGILSSDYSDEIQRIVDHFNKI